MFGLTRYNATQMSGSLTALMISDIGNSKHKISTGLSFAYDHLDETLKDTNMIREEVVPGIFGEYTFNPHIKWTVMAGIRADYNNIYGFGVNPRMHIKFCPWSNTTVRVSAGHGIRTANVIPEHIGLLASSRRFIYDEIPEQEKAWNYGIGIVKRFQLGNKGKATLSIDFFRTDFLNQVVVDVDQSPEAVHIYNLQGPSYSNSFQTDLIIEPLKRFEITLAYRYNDVEMTVDNELSELPLTPKNRALLALHYATKYETWKFSFTTQYLGKTRLPDTQQNPEEYRLPETSPDYFLLYAQVTFKFSKFETFIGCENITDYKQKDPILAANDPFGKYFDTSIIYGPILGRQFNFGLRFKLE
jgi:outer membrane receptor protein involved in Fe transport